MVASGAGLPRFVGRGTTEVRSHGVSGLESFLIKNFSAGDGESFAKQVYDKLGCDTAVGRREEVQLQ